MSAPRALHDDGKAEIDSWTYDTVAGQSVTVKRKRGKGTRPWREPGGIEGPYLPLDIELLDGEPTLVIVEGERDRDAMRSKASRWPVTCWISGAQNWDKTDWSMMKGRKVILFPDRDQKGVRAMEELADHLDELGADTWAADIPDSHNGEPDGAGAADYTPGEIEGILDRAYKPEKVGAETAGEIETQPGTLPDPATWFETWQPIPGLMEVDGFALWHGPPKGGKSAYALLAGAQLLSGRELVGIANQEPHNPADRREHKLLFLWLEETEIISQGRRWAICQRHELDPAIWDNSHWTYGPLPMGDDKIEGLETLVDRIKPTVIFIDTLAMFEPAAEGNSQDASKCASLLKQLARRQNSAVVVVHHDRKMPGQDGGKNSGDEMSRGSSALIGSSRVMVQITADAEGKTVDIEGGGTNNAKSARSMRFALESEMVNGRSVVVLQRTKKPDPFEDVPNHKGRKIVDAIADAEPDRRFSSPQSDKWAGHIVAAMLELDAGAGKRMKQRSEDEKAAFDKVSGILDAWLRSGVLKTKKEKCADRKEHPVFIKGKGL